MSKAPLAYVIRPFDVKHNDLRPAAHLRCASCPETGKLIITVFGNNPDKIKMAFARLGWDCDVHNASRNYCPRCVKKQELEAKAASDRKVQLASGLRDAQKNQALAPPQEKKPMTSSSPRGGKEVGIKSLTPDQKAALRRELDNTFDDSTGRYIEGNSDHAISERLDIPRIIVEEFRENFYGELRSDPEIAAFEAQLAQLKGVLSNLQDTANKMEIKLNELRKRVGL